MTDQDLLAAGTLRLVGSTLTKRKPRDVDLVLTIPDRLFVRLFGNIRRWLDEGETGQWTDSRHRWSDTCVRISHELRRRMATDKMVDFKIVPASHADHGRIERRARKSPSPAERLRTDPAARRKFEAALGRHRKITQPLVDACERSARLTAEDFATRVNV